MNSFLATLSYSELLTFAQGNFSVMDSEPVRIVFLTERDDEAIQCRVQDYRLHMEML